MRVIPDRVWQRIVEYIGKEKRLKEMATRDWRFEEARAMVNKCARCIDHLCWRYLYPVVLTQQAHSLDQQWTLTLCYWLRVVKHRKMSWDIKKRSVISDLRIYHGTDTTLDRKRVLNMYVYAILKAVLLYHPGEIMCNPRAVKSLLNRYLTASVKRPLPRPPRVASALGELRTPSVIEIMRSQLP